MAEGSPLLAIKRGDKVAMPPAIWIQTRGDLIHDYRDPNSGFDGSEAQRFAAMYRKAGGSIDLQYFDAPLHFTNDHPELPESQRALKARGRLHQAADSGEVKALRRASARAGRQKMEPLQRAINDLVIANRILAHHGVFDEYGHVSMRHPTDPARFLLARELLRGLVEPGDIVEFDARRRLRSTTTTGRSARERFVHAAIYEARPDVKSVVCASSEDMQPFSITGTRLDRCSAPSATWARGFRSGTSRKNSATTPTSRFRTWSARAILRRSWARMSLVLTRGVGFVATGRTLNDAVRMSVYIPKNARAFWRVVAIRHRASDLARRDARAPRDRPGRLCAAPRLGILGEGGRL